MKRLRVELMAGEGARRRLTEKKCQAHGKTAIEVAVAKYAEQREAAAAKDAEEREAAAAPKKRRAPTESQRIGEPKNRCEVEKNRICHFHSLHADQAGATGRATLRLTSHRSDARDAIPVVRPAAAAPAAATNDR